MNEQLALLISGAIIGGLTICFCVIIGFLIALLKLRKKENKR